MPVVGQTFGVCLSCCCLIWSTTSETTTIFTTTPPHARPATDRSYALPPLGDNPSTDRQGTTPGSFALPGRVGTPYMFSSPDTPGMPGVSDMTAMDFLPDGWTAWRRIRPEPEAFNPITQLESARLGSSRPR